VSAVLSRALAVACLATGLAFAAQWLLVHFAYDGNWTALFHSGEKYGTPPELAVENIYLFPGSYGFDGQIYHYIAHDPLMHRGVSDRVDAPRLRYRRILVPLLAWTFAGGGGSGVDRAYRAIVLIFVFLGCYWSARVAAGLGRSPHWGAAFLLLPATIVSLERMTVDVALAALVAGWVLAIGRRPSRLQWLALALAPLVRETGLILVAAAVIVALSQRRIGSAIAAAATALPAGAWFAFVQARTPPLDYPNSFVPLSGIVGALIHPAPYPAGRAGGSGLQAAWRSVAPTAMQMMDGIAVVAIVVAFVLAARWLLMQPRSALAWAAGLFALLGAFTQRPENWIHVYDFGRVYTPLLMLLAFEGLARNERRWLVPWCLLEPRLFFQLSGPAMSTVKGLLTLRVLPWT
jgi:hypothetical protein